MKFNHAVFDNFPILRTPRITLRDIRMEDAHRIFDMRANDRVNAFIAREAMEKEEAAATLVTRTRDAYTSRSAIGWAGILRNTEGIMGTCGYSHIDIPNLRAEIGGEMATEYWGKGIAQEAVQAILAFGFETMGLHTIEAKIWPDNRGARHILESLGFRKEAHFRDRFLFQGSFKDLAVYTLISGEQTF